jgi:phytoene desaturase
MDSASQVSKMATRYFLYNPFARVGSLMVGEVLGSLNRLRMLLTQSLKRFVNKRFQHPVIRQILGYPAVFLGTHPEDAPAMYHLMSALDLDEGVLYPMGGFWAFVERMEALALEAGVTITTGAEVTGIDCGPVRPSSSQKPSVRGVNWRDEHGETHYVPADIVVSGADLHHTETKLVPEDFRSYPERWWQKRVSGPGAVIVLLGVKGKLPELPHHSLFFTRDWDSNFKAIFGDTPSIPNPTSVYVCKPSETDDQVAPAEHENLFVLVPITPDPTIGSGGSEGQGDTRVEATADAVIDQIAEWAKIPDLRERIVVRETLGPQDFVSDYFSWQGGMLGPAHILSQSAMFRAQNVSKKVNGLYYAGATTAPGVGLPMCLISAELVLKHIRGDHSAGPTQADATSDVRVRN